MKAALTKFFKSTDAEIILAILLFKIFIFAFVLYSDDLLPNLWSQGSYQNNFHWPMESPRRLKNHFKTWDGNHYLFLAEVGYGPSGKLSNAFYPLWPYLISGLATLISPILIPNWDPFFWAGIILANLFSLFAFWYFFAWVRKRSGERIAVYSLYCLMLYPGSIFYQFLYSESLFLLLSLFLVDWVEKGKWIQAWIPAILLPLTRATGIFFFGYAAVAIFMSTKKNEWKLSSPLLWKKISLLLAVLGGFSLYLLLMKHTLGDMFAGIEAQKNFLVYAQINRLWDIPAFMHAMTKTYLWHGYQVSFIDRFFFLLAMYSSFLLIKKDFQLFCICVALVLLPAMLNHFTAMMRYISVVFPLFEVWAIYLITCKEWQRFMLIVSMGALYFVLFFRYISNYWVA